jgi:hypothetical protein
VSDEERKAALPEVRPPRLRLIRAFLSLLVGFMAGLVGWTIVVMAAVLGQGPTTNAMTRLPSLPPVLQFVAFFVPAVVVGGWLFSALGSSR